MPDRPDGIEPGGLRAPLVTFDRNAGPIDDVAFDVLCAQRAADLPRVLAGPRNL